MDSLDPEQAVLGAMLIEPRNISQALAILTAEDFEKPHHQRLYTVIVGLHQKGRIPDPVSVAAEFNGLGPKVSAYMGKLIHGLPRITNLRPWADKIKAESTRRQLLSLVTDFVSKAGDHERDIYELLQDLARKATSLGRAGKRLGWLENAALVKEAVGLIEARTEAPQGIVGLSTGLTELDGKLQGLRPGQLVGIGGRPGTGKTSLCQQIAKHVSKMGRHVAFFSLEMTAVEVTEREIGSDADVNLASLFYSRPDEKLDRMARITRSASQAMAGNLHKTDGVLSVEEIESLSVEALNRWGLDLIVIDYFQMVKTPPAERRNEALTKVSTGLKQLAMRLRVPVIMALQLNRNPEGRQDRRPSLGDISYCDSPAMDCHSVILIHQGNDREVTELIIDKNRSGYAGKATCRFIPELCKFVDA